MTGRNCASACWPAIFWSPDRRSGSGSHQAVAKRVLERMDTFLDERDDTQRMPSYGKVGFAAVVGNEDGAHHVAAEVCQALAEVGFTIPTGGVTYWVGEAMGDKNYVDLRSTPKAVAEWTPVLASNAAHLANLLEEVAVPRSQKQQVSGPRTDIVLPGPLFCAICKTSALPKRS